MKRELSKQITQDQLAALSQAMPVEPGFKKIILPRLGFYSQDQIEGKGKNMKVTTEAGTFYFENQSEEVDENGKKIWAREEIGSSVEGIILFQRKQLKLYDEKTEKYTNSPIYDSEEEIVPLFCDKKEIKRGKPAELKESYKYTDKNGKTKSALEENRILYILIDEKLYQLNLRGSSMYSFFTYQRKTLVPSVVTKITSEPKEKGEINWNQMIFTAERQITETEAEKVISIINDTKLAIIQEKGNFKSDDQLENYGKDVEIVADEIDL